MKKHSSRYIIVGVLGIIGILAISLAQIANGKKKERKEAFQTQFNIGKKAYQKGNFIDARKAIKLAAIYETTNDDSTEKLLALIQDSISNGQSRLYEKFEQFLYKNDFSNAKQILVDWKSKYNDSGKLKDLQNRLSSQFDDVIESNLADATQLISENKFKLANEKLEIVTKLVPDDPRIDLLKEEIQAIIEKDKQEKRREFNKFISEGDVCLNQKKCECAKQFFKRARDLNIDNRLASSKIKSAINLCNRKVVYTPTVRRKSSDDNIYVSKVEITANETLITLSFRKSNTSGLVWPVGHKEAFRLEKSRGEVLSQLKGVRGLGSNKTGENFTNPVKSFTLVFDKLPRGISKVNLIEGSGNMETSVYWTFIGVDVNKLNL